MNKIKEIKISPGIFCWKKNLKPWGQPKKESVSWKMIYSLSGDLAGGALDLGQ